MRPSMLRKGMQVRRVDGPVLTFIARDSLRRISMLQSDAYRGLYGPDDRGVVWVSDWDMSRKYMRVHAYVSEGR